LQLSLPAGAWLTSRGQNDRIILFLLCFNPPFPATKERALMKKRYTRLLAAALALALLGTTPVWAEDSSEAPAPDNLFTLGVASEYGDVPIYDESASPAQDDGIATLSLDGASDLPSAYDSRDYGYVPPVRNQGTWNTCWAMAATAAAEVDGLQNALLGTTASTTDLSERHLIYFMTHQVADPLGNSSGDYNKDMSYWLQAGGNPVLATMTLASWHGIASESATNTAYSGLSASDSLSDTLAYADEMHLENTYALDLSTDSGRTSLKQLLMEHGGAVLSLYYDTAYLYAGLSVAAGAVVTDGASQEIDQAEPSETPEPTEEPESTEAPALPEGTTPPVADTEPTPDAPEEAETPDQEEAPEPVPTPEEEAPEAEIESQPGSEPETESEPDLEPDAEATALVLDGSALEETEAEPITDGATPGFTVCYYKAPATNDQGVLQDPGTNHEVLIVGWDDDYPAENFALSSQHATPAGNGAWLCRNSYGDNWKSDGYFWVSYYDASITYPTDGNLATARVTVFDFASASNYDHNYEYDGAAVMGYINVAINGKGVSTATAGSSTRRWYGNVFTASGNSGGAELLQAVSTYTYRPNVPYTLRIYTNVTDETDPTSGTLAYEASGTFPFAGFHTVTLDKDIFLTEGAKYAVVFQVAMASDKSIYIPACYTFSSWKSVNTSQAGQSFVSLDGSTWYDCYNLTWTSSQQNITQANVRIKAYTVDAPPFTDIASSDWYYAAVNTAWSKGLVRGYTATTYCPTLAATRGQVMTVLYRLAGSPTTSYRSTFLDVTRQWYFTAVSWGQYTGLAQGSDDNGDGLYAFRPEDTITREEFFTLLYRYAKWAGKSVSSQSDLSAFSDKNSVSDWALTATRWSVAAGLQEGDTSQRLRPQATLTRAELATVLVRFSQFLSK
jgi:C1A family cysteine protease